MKLLSECCSTFASFASACYGYCWLALEPDFSLALFPCPCRLSGWWFLVQFVSQSVKLFGCSSCELEHFALEHFVWVL